MNTTKIIIYIVILLLTSTDVSSQQTCEATISSELTRIYFANGMSNQESDADRNALRIGELLLWSRNNAYKTSYNFNENWLIQLLQVYEQKKEEQQLEVEPEEYWYWLRNMDEAPQWFQEVYQQNMQQFKESSVYSDPDLLRHVNNYVRDIYNGKRVVIVAHSQGNFYANNAYRRILNEFPEYRQNIGIVGVATPTDTLLGWNNYNAVYPYGLYYTTNESDLVINLIRAFYPDTLPPNPPSIGHSNNFLSSNHEFVDIYLDKNGPFRNRIRNQIFQTINLVQIPEAAPECKGVTVDTLPASNISTNSARLNGKVTDGNNVSYGFVIKPSYDSSPLSCYDINLSTSGNLKAGDQFYSNVSLQPGTTYYYRACGRDRNRISSGPILNFKTTAIPVKSCGSSYAASGGSEGLAVKYNMGPKGGHVQVEFETYTIPDKLEIWQGGTRIYTTGGYVSGYRKVEICHHSANGSVWDVKVFGNPDTGTAWNLKISCPESRSAFDLCY